MGKDSSCCMPLAERGQQLYHIARGCSKCTPCGASQRPFGGMTVGWRPARRSRQHRWCPHDAVTLSVSRAAPVHDTPRSSPGGSWRRSCARTGRASSSCTRTRRCARSTRSGPRPGRSTAWTRWGFGNPTHEPYHCTPIKTLSCRVCQPSKQAEPGCARSRCCGDWTWRLVGTVLASQPHWLRMCQYAHEQQLWSLGVMWDLLSWRCSLQQAQLPLSTEYDYFNLGTGVNVYIVDTVRASHPYHCMHVYTPFCWQTLRQCPRPAYVPVARGKPLEATVHANHWYPPRRTRKTLPHRAAQQG